MTHAQLYESCIITLEGSLAMERGAYYNGDEFSTEADKITQYIIKNRCDMRAVQKTSKDGTFTGWIVQFEASGIWMGCMVFSDRVDAGEWIEHQRKQMSEI